MWYTHVLVAIILMCLLGFSPMLIPIGIFAAILPDIDAPRSLMGRLFPKLSVRIDGRYGHRTITHSIAALISVSSPGILGPSIVLPLFVGYGSHLILDMLTPSGVPLLYPSIKEFVIFGGPVSTGSSREKAIFIILLSAVLCFKFLSLWGIQPLYLLKSILTDSSKVHAGQCEILEQNSTAEAKISGYWSYSKAYVEMDAAVTDCEGSTLYVEYNGSIYSVSNQTDSSITPTRIELQTANDSQIAESISWPKVYSNYSEFVENLSKNSLISGEVYFYNQISTEQQFDIEQSQLEKLESFALVKSGSSMIKFRRVPSYLLEKISCCVPNGTVKAGMISTVKRK
jgi:inner membrane protein